MEPHTSVVESQSTWTVEREFAQTCIGHALSSTINRKHNHYNAVALPELELSNRILLCRVTSTNTEYVCYIDT